MEYDEILTLEDVTKTYPTPEGKFRALDGVGFTLQAGEMIALSGKSGSGKTTLLNIIAAIDFADSGTVRLLGVDPRNPPRGDIESFRGDSLGIVFQFFQLLPSLTILENVMLPMDFRGGGEDSAGEERALRLLEKTGVRDQADKFPRSLSGGQQQRAAIARALANDPPLILADEPTGNLDSKNAASIFGLFRELAHEGKGVLIVTHETEFFHFFDRTVLLKDGRIVSIREESKNHVAAL